MADEYNDQGPSGTPKEPFSKQSRRRDIGVSRVVGGTTGVLALLIPVVYFWLSNSKEVALAQIKNTAEQIAYVTKRMEDSDKERDLYKKEMLDAQKEARDTESQLFACQRELREYKK